MTILLLMALLSAVFFSSCGVSFQVDSKPSKPARLERAEFFTAELSALEDFYAQHQRERQSQSLLTKDAIKVAATMQMLECQLNYLSADEAREYMKPNRCMNGCDYKGDFEKYKGDLVSRLGGYVYYGVNGRFNYGELNSLADQRRSYELAGQGCIKE